MSADTVGDEFSAIADHIAGNVIQAFLQLLRRNEVIQFLVDFIRILAAQAEAVIEDIAVVVILLAVDVAGDHNGGGASYRLNDDVGSRFGQDDVAFCHEFVHVGDKAVDLHEIGKKTLFFLFGQDLVEPFIQSADEVHGDVF